MELIMPNDSSDEIAKSKELQDTLRSAQVPFTVSESSDGLIFKVNDSYEKQLMNATEALGIETDSFGADAEDDAGSSGEIYRTEASNVLDQVADGELDARKALDDMIEGANPFHGGGPGEKTSTKNKMTGKDGAKELALAPPRVGGSKTGSSHSPQK